MKITTSRRQIQSCLERVIQATISSSVNPILSNVLLRTKEKTLTMIATNHEIQITTTCEVQTRESFERILPATKLQSILSSLDPEAELVIEFKEETATITSGRSHFKLVINKTDDFTLLGETSKMETLAKLPSKQLLRAFKEVYYASAVQSHRMNLNGVLVDRSVNDLTLVATDGHRMAVKKLGQEQKSESQHILPRKTVDILVQRLRDEGEVEMSCNDRAFKFKTDEFEMVSNIIDDKFPDYQAALPVNNQNIAVIEWEKLKSAMRHVVALSSRDNTVTMGFNENRLKIESTNKDTDSLSEEIDINYAGPEMELGFNISFLYDFLNALSSDNKMIEMKIADSTCGVLMREKTEEGNKESSLNYVVMPVRI